MDSDLDLTLVFNNFEIDHRKILKKIRILLSRSDRFSCNNKPLKISSGHLLEVIDKMNKLHVDIAINKTMEVLNSHLVCAYGVYDFRFVKLALFLKVWNKLNFSQNS